MSPLTGRARTFFGVFCAMYFLFNFASASTVDELKTGWDSPARTYKSHTRWWWPGNVVTKDEISWQLEQELQGSEVGPDSQLSAFAKIRAALVFPTPRGPQNNNAWAS